MKPLQISFRFCLHLYSRFHSCHCTLPHVHPALQLNFCWILHVQYLSIISGKKSPNQHNCSNLKSNFNLLSHGKKCPNQQQKLCFSSTRWVLRDTTLSLLTFPRALEIHKLSGKELCWYTTFGRMFSLKDKTKNRSSLLQQSLKLICNCGCVLLGKILTCHK